MTLSLRLNIKNNEGSLNNLYSFSCTPCYLVHYRASKRFDFHDHVSYHRKVSIDNSTLLSSAPFHVDNEAAGRSTNPALSWSKPSAQSRQVRMKLIWNIAYLNQMFALITNMFYSPYITYKICTLLVNECKSSLSLLIIVHIWMFIYKNSLAFCTTLIFNH